MLLGLQIIFAAFVTNHKSSIYNRIISMQGDNTVAYVDTCFKVRIDNNISQVTDMSTV